MTVALLRGYDQGLKLNAAGVTVNAAGDTYCLHKTVGNKDAWVVRGTTPQNGSDGEAGDIRETGLAPVAPFAAC